MCADSNDSVARRPNLSILVRAAPGNLKDAALSAAQGALSELLSQPQRLQTPRGPRHHHSFRGPISAGSTPIFASKYAFCSMFQDLQEYHLLASKSAKFYKNSQNIVKILRIFARFCNVCSFF